MLATLLKATSMVKASARSGWLLACCTLALLSGCTFGRGGIPDQVLFQVVRDSESTNGAHDTRPEAGPC